MLVGAQLSSTGSLCNGAGFTITFSLDVDPRPSPTPGTYLLGSTMTDSSGQATVSVGTTGWLDGVYTITATFTATTYCASSYDTATLTVTVPGNAAEGGGWYTLSGSGRANFGFEVRQDCKACGISGTNCPTCNAYKGQLLLINNGKWRVKGALNTFTKVAVNPNVSQGAASGTGNLYWWDATLNGGLGGWTLSQAGAVYTASFEDNGTCTKNTCSDKFGIIINHLVVSPPEPGTLPNSSPIQIKGGNITIR